jgi:hypothetical protein
MNARLGLQHLSGKEVTGPVQASKTCRFGCIREGGRQDGLPAHVRILERAGINRQGINSRSDLRHTRLQILTEKVSF